MEVDRHKGLHPHGPHVENTGEGGWSVVSGVEEAQQVEEVGGEAGEAGTLRVTLQKYIVISV